jgi:hypothetical protein
MGNIGNNACKSGKKINPVSKDGESAVMVGGVMAQSDGISHCAPNTKGLQLNRQGPLL